MEYVTLWIRNAKVYNTFLKRFENAHVAVKGDRFFCIDRRREYDFQAEEILDAKGAYMIPGLIDIHMHIESSMMTPAAMAKCLAKNGVTSIVSEPHEMANVKGVRGIEAMIRAGERAPVDIFYGIPSSVPSTDCTLETTGGEIDADSMKELLRRREVVCVGEVMNFRGIIQNEALEISRFLEYLRKKRQDFPVEGHCPSLKNLDLAKYLYAGIDADHTEHTLEEVRQRLENGMFFEIQNKMLKPDIIKYIKQNALYEYCAFVTDDTMADCLVEKGQLNYVVERAIQMGFPMEQAIYCATYTPARRMHLDDRGAVAPGKLADFSLTAQPDSLRPQYVYKSGKCVYEAGGKGKIIEEQAHSEREFPEDFYRSIQIFEEQIKAFSSVKVPCQNGNISVRAMEVFPDQTQTKEKRIEMEVRNGELQWKNSGCILAAVLERYGKNKSVGIGFLTGSCHKKGTIATTYFHDHHNLMVAGDDPADMELAVRRIADMQGGYLTVRKGKILSELSLPVGGILSDQPPEEVARRLSKVRLSMEELGYRHENPIMSFSCLGLPVSPDLKLTNFGLIDVKAGRRVPLIISDRDKEKCEVL